MDKIGQDHDFMTQTYKLYLILLKHFLYFGQFVVNLTKPFFFNTLNKELIILGIEPL